MQSTTTWCTFFTMVDTQHFCLRWNNYQSSITSAFENLRDDEDFVDVTLACDGKSLKAHRVVLSACSPYFRELLKSTPCKHPVIVLQDVAWTDLHALVEFIYHGEVNVHQRSLSSFLKTAEVLRVSGLTQQHGGGGGGDSRDQLAQVQSMVRSQQLQQQQQHTSTPISHHPSFTEKLVEDTLFPSPPSPPQSATTVNQLLRRAALQYRRERRILSEPDGEHKRARAAEHIIGNNNNNELNLSSHTQPPQTQPADFSPSGMKSNPLNLNLNSNMKIEGNGISSTEREHSPCSPSPNALHHSSSRCSVDNNSTGTTLPDNGNGIIKSEPMELLCNTTNMNNQDADNSDDSDVGGGGTSGIDGGGGGGNNSLPQGPHSGGSGATLNDHDDHDSTIGPYLTPSESKLFASTVAASGFNFSMAALAADPAALGGLNHSLQGGDSLAGTSQVEEVVVSPYTPQNRQRMASLPPPPPSPLQPLPLSATSHHRCDVCGKLLSTKLTLKRHKEQQHYQPLNNAVCTLCCKVFRTLNSLNNHRSIYHRRPKLEK